MLRHMQEKEPSKAAKALGAFFAGIGLFAFVQGSDGLLDGSNHSGVLFPLQIVAQVGTGVLVVHLTQGFRSSGADFGVFICQQICLLYTSRCV